MGTKTLEFAAISNALIGEKVSIHNGLQGSMILSKTNSSIIFYSLLLNIKDCTK